MSCCKQKGSCYEFGAKEQSTSALIGVKPVGSHILVEILTAQESLGTKLTVTNTSDVGAPQGYVLAVGPSFKEEDWGFTVGDRVLLQGKHIPLPIISEGRSKSIVEPTMIKAVLVEKNEG